MFEVRTQRLIEGDPVIREVMARPDSLLEGLEGGDLKRAKELFNDWVKEISDQYQQGSDVLETFAEYMRNARGAGDIPQILHQREVGDHLSRTGNWGSGVPGDGNCVPTRPDIQKKMLEHYMEVSKQYPDLTLEDFWENPFKDGYPDFSKYVDHGWQSNKPGVAYLTAEDFVLPKVDESGKKLTKKEAKSKLRAEHDRKADEQWAQKMSALYPDEQWSAETAETYRKLHGLTWHHVENSNELQLVPSWLHGHIGHKGGVSTSST